MICKGLGISQKTFKWFFDNSNSLASFPYFSVTGVLKLYIIQNCDTLSRNIINPFKTDKTVENGNLGQCLKWEPQAKCH